MLSGTCKLRPFAMVVDLNAAVRRYGFHARVTQVAVLGGGRIRSSVALAGDPVRVDYVVGVGRKAFVLHTQRPDAFGHDRRSDRVASTLYGLRAFKVRDTYV